MDQLRWGGIDKVGRVVRGEAPGLNKRTDSSAYAGVVF